MSKIYVIRNDNHLVGVADTIETARVLALDDADDFKIRQVLARGFAKLFKKNLIKLDHPHYKFTTPISTEVSDEVF